MFGPLISAAVCIFSAAGIQDDPYSTAAALSHQDVYRGKTYVGRRDVYVSSATIPLVTNDDTIRECSLLVVANIPANESEESLSLAWAPQPDNIRIIGKPINGLEGRVKDYKIYFKANSTQVLHLKLVRTNSMPEMGFDLDLGSLHYQREPERAYPKLIH